MAEQAQVDADGAVRLPARRVPAPAFLSEAARAVLAMPRMDWTDYPPLDDKTAWRALAARRDSEMLSLVGAYAQMLEADTAETSLGGVRTMTAAPRGERLADDEKVIFDIHGGALLFFGGALMDFNAKAMALRTGRKTYSVDYRMPPDHPYPTPLNDCLAAYAALIERYDPRRIVVTGTSAGGNLAAAMALRARAEGLPAPAGLILLTPEVDLSESGDSFDTLMGLDTRLTARLMPINLLYANGADLKDPLVSPIFGDFTPGFPPTMLQAGTRDIFLSNTVVMHRRLRAAGVRAELHVWDGMPHAGFGGVAPEDQEVNAEMRAFIASL